MLIVALIAVMGWAGNGLSAQKKIAYEKPPVRKASEVLPPPLVKGNVYNVLNPVTNVESLNNFKVKTDWGTHEIYGEVLLRIRLQEFVALAKLQHTSSARVAATSAGKQAAKTFVDFGKAVAHPVDTAKGLPGGVVRMFKGIGRDAIEIVKAGRDAVEDKDTGGAVYLAKKYAGISKPYREWAQAVGVDPYTTNSLLKNELNRISAVEAVAKFGVGFVVPPLPGALGLVADVSDTVYKKDWRDLFENNRKDMQAMGVNNKVIVKFEESDSLTPSLMTLIVKALVSMKGVKDRHYVIGQAALIESEVQALFFGECVMLAQWFHQNKTPLKAMLLETLIPVGLTRDGRVVAFSAADYAYWDKQTASLAASFTKKYKKYGQRREAWVADLVSPRFEQGMSDLGWDVHSKLRRKILPEIPWGLQDTAHGK